MKIVFAALLLGALTHQAEAASCRWKQPGESWGTLDKRQHFQVGLLVGATVSLATGNPMAGFGAGAAVAIGKELRDSVTHGHTCSGMDAAASIAGAALASGSSALVLRAWRGGAQVTYQARF